MMKGQTTASLTSEDATPSNDLSAQLRSQQLVIDGLTARNKTLAAENDGLRTAAGLTTGTSGLKLPDLTKYSKFIVALGAPAGVAVAALGDNVLSNEEVGAIVASLVTAFLVLLVPNKQSKPEEV